MTDVRKVISQFNVQNLVSTSSGTTTNLLKTPEGDRPVFLNKIGFLDLDYPHVFSGISSNLACADLATVRANSNFQILGGAYFNASVILDPSVLDFRHILIKAVIGSTATWQLPDPGPIITYLKNTFGAENITAGLMWSLIIMNDSATTDDLTLQINTPLNTFSSVIPNGFVVSGSSWVFTVNGKSSSGNIKTTNTLRFLLKNVTPGFEVIEYYMTGG